MDIDYHTIINTANKSVSIGLGDRAVSGNRQLLNQFEVVFLTSWKQYYIPETRSVEKYMFGGNFIKMSGLLSVNNPQSVLSAVSVAVKNTVSSIKGEQSGLNLDPTEKLQSADVKNLSVHGDIVTCDIQVVPEQVESPGDLLLNLPVIQIEGQQSV